VSNPTKNKAEAILADGIEAADHDPAGRDGAVDSPRREAARLRAL
jgi:hypothetical protein